MASLTTNILNLYGAEGKLWIDHLPELSSYFANLWRLGKLTPIKDLSYHAVYFSTHEPVVLKLGLDQEALRQEAHALTAYRGQGCVRLIQSDLGKGALLIARAKPGISLKCFFPQDDLRATGHAATVMKQLHVASIPDTTWFPMLRDWFVAFDKTTSLPEAYLAKARSLAQVLLETSPKSVLLHGDLHHDNILCRGEDDWVAIDPKGILGDPGYEVGAFINNPIPNLLDYPTIPDLLNQRLSRFSVLLNQNPVRLCQWSYVQAVLAACWTIEDNGNPEFFLKVAEYLESLNDPKKNSPVNFSLT